MAPTADEHRRTHNLLLVNNLLNQAATSSPFTLILDTLEQTSHRLVDEYARRAKESKAKTIYVSFETIKKHDITDLTINAWSMPVTTWQKQIVAEISTQQTGRTLLIMDSLNAASAIVGQQLPSLLSSLLSPQVSLVAVYHLDVPAVTSSIPSTLSLMSYLATTIMTVHSLHHVLARKAARDRSVMEPEFGLEEGIEGVIRGLGSSSAAGLVIEMEHRRKSGRGVKEWFVLQSGSSNGAKHTTGRARQNICLLEDYPGYKKDNIAPPDTTTGEALSTFELSLTERQRQDREGVVLPYFDAQRGNDEGGRILYDMGSEDDFDEEEDEI